jgi:hypothetical protein
MTHPDLYDSTGSSWLLQIHNVWLLPRALGLLSACSFTAQCYTDVC